VQFTALSIAAATIGFSSSILQEGTRQSRHHRERTLPRCLFGWRLVIAFPVSVLVSWLNAPSKGAFFNLRSAGRYHAKFSLGKNRRGACRDPDAGTQETLPTAFNSRLLTDWHDRAGCGRTGMLPGGVPGTTNLFGLASVAAALVETEKYPSSRDLRNRKGNMGWGEAERIGTH